MAARDLLYFRHMLDAARRIVAKTQDIDRARYDEDDNLRLALAHLVQTIGEAARRVSPQDRALHPEIPWRRVTGMRHRIVHDYMNVDEDILWEVVTRSVPELITLLAAIVPPDGDDASGTVPSSRPPPSD